MKIFGELYAFSLPSYWKQIFHDCCAPGRVGFQGERHPFTYKALLSLASFSDFLCLRTEGCLGRGLGKQNEGSAEPGVSGRESPAVGRQELVCLTAASHSRETR